MRRRECLPWLDDQRRWLRELAVKALTGLFGGAAAGEAVDTASAFAAGSSIKYSITKLLNKVDGPAIGDSCGCEKSNSGIGAALHNLIY